MTVIIAIDGLSASGKGTITKATASKLGYDYLDTGLLYRKLALFVIENQIDPSEEDVMKIITSVDFTAEAPDDIGSEKYGSMASRLGVYKRVREYLNEFQRTFPNNRVGAVIDGRDIGTVIFPNANHKFFITANLEVRAQRRHKQLKERGNPISFQAVFEDLKARDEKDINRPISPTIPASDAIIIDNSHYTIEETVDVIYTSIKG